jgi:hypothetical protein
VQSINENNVRVREAYAYEFTVRFDVDLDGRTYDVAVDFVGDGYDVEAWDDQQDSVDVEKFVGRLGFSSLHTFAEAMVDGFYLDGPEGFALSIPAEVK